MNVSYYLQVFKHVRTETIKLQNTYLPIKRFNLIIFFYKIVSLMLKIQRNI